MNSKSTGTPANVDRATKDDSQRQNRVAVLFLVLSFFMILSLSFFLYSNYVKASELGRLSVSIRADSQADYHPDATKVVFPQINKNILNQIITEIPATGSPQDREGTLVAVLLSPVPTMTPDDRLVATATLTATPPEIPTLTPSPTASFTPSYTPTPLRTNSPTVTRTITTTLTRTLTPIVTRSLTPTPSRTFTITPTRTPSLTYTPTPSRTFTITPTRTPSLTYTPTATQTVTHTPTDTLTPTYTPTSTETPTATETVTPTPTDTLTPTYTPTVTDTPTHTVTPANTSTFTPTATFTITPSGPVSCNPSEIKYSSSPNIYFNTNELLADITNNYSSAIRITELHLEWQDAGPTKLDFIQLGGTDIWDRNGNIHDDTPPSDFAVSGSEFSWDSSNGARTINSGSGNTKTLLINFDPNDPLPAGQYLLRVTFGLSANCYIETSITKP